MWETDVAGFTKWVILRVGTHLCWYIKEMLWWKRFSLNNLYSTQICSELVTSFNCVVIKFELYLHCADVVSVALMKAFRTSQ